jgi:hypothetical protein
VDRVFYNILHWFFFSFVLALLPIALAIWTRYSAKEIKNIEDIAMQLTQHGEILLICIPIIGFGIGELVKAPKHPNATMSLFLFGMSLCLILSCAFVYTQATSLAIEAHYLYNTSKILLLATLLIIIAIISFTSNKKRSKYECLY